MDLKRVLVENIYRVLNLKGDADAKRRAAHTWLRNKGMPRT